MGVGRNPNRTSYSFLREARGQVLSWFGIIGIALTIANNWSNLVTLADWVHWVINHWGIVLHEFWTWVGSFIGIRISKSFSLILSYVTFILSLGFGTALREGFRWNEHDDGEGGDVDRACALFVPVVPLAIFADIFIDWSSISTSEAGERSWFWLTCSSVGVMYIFAILMEGAYYFRFIASFIYFIIFYLVFSKALVAFSSPNAQEHSSLLAWGFMFMLICSLIPLIIAQSVPLIRRVSFILVGVGVIFGLNEISKFAKYLQTAAQSAS